MNMRLPLARCALAVACCTVAGCAANPPRSTVSHRVDTPAGGTRVAKTENADRPIDSDTYTVDFIGADLCAAPAATAAHLALLPEGTVLVPLARESYFIKVNYQGQIGWVSTAGLERHMAVPSADLEFHHSGYKVVGSQYRYFFGFANRGVQPYSGNIAVRLYAGNTEIPLGGIGATGKTAQAYAPNDESDKGYPINPGDVIEPSQMRGCYLVADTLATRYVFETAQGRKTGAVGGPIAD